MLHCRGGVVVTLARVGTILTTSDSKPCSDFSLPFRYHSSVCSDPHKTRCCVVWRFPALFKNSTAWNTWINKSNRLGEKREIGAKRTNCKVGQSWKIATSTNWTQLGEWASGTYLITCEIRPRSKRHVIGPITFLGKYCSLEVNLRVFG